jgi:hypothetical protein
MRKTLGDRKRGIQWGMKDKLEDLDFAMTYVYCHRDILI